MTADPTHLISLFENATEGIILTNAKGVIVLVNPAAERMFGFDANELINQPVEVLLPDSMRSHHEHVRNGFYQHPSNRVMGHGRDLYGKKRDGEKLPVEVSLSHYHRDGEMFVIAFIVDITQRKQIEQNMLEQQEKLEKLAIELQQLNIRLEAKVEERTVILREALEKLEQSQSELNEALQNEKLLSEMKGRFVSMASHEFRTPLSAVLSSASLLSHYTLTDEQDKRDRHITKIRGAVHQLNHILEDFLSLGKINEGKLSIQFAPLDIPLFIRETLDSLEGLKKKGQSIEYRHQGDAVVTTDQHLLKNIIINLANNAIKFSNEDQPVIVESSVTSAELFLRVIDQGIGISHADQSNLFSSFYRGSNAVNIQGTGLGLHIVKRYVDMLHGFIDLQSELNKGTSITIRIPLDR